MAFGLDIGSIYARVKADTTHFVKGMNTVVKTSNATAATVVAAGSRIAKSFALIGSAVGVISLREFAKFDDAMTRSTAIMGKALTADTLPWCSTSVQKE